MKISNREELRKFLKFYFSNNFEGLKNSEEEEIKKVIKKSIEDIPGAVGEIKEIAIIELSRAERRCPECFEGNSNLILFITECLSEEERKKLIIRYLKTTQNYNGDDIVINTKILLSMLDYLPDELKVNVLTNARPVDLVRMMGEVHKHTNLWVTLNVMYYKKYYVIFKKALAE